jgi:hypothetical protein
MPAPDSGRTVWALRNLDVMDYEEGQIGVLSSVVNLTWGEQNGGAVRRSTFNLDVQLVTSGARAVEIVWLVLCNILNDIPA